MTQQDIGDSHRQQTGAESRKVFDGQRGLVLLRLFFLACRVLPRSITIRLALQIFLTPGRKPMGAGDAALHDSAQRELVFCRGREVVTYKWGNSSRCVLLCHAWGERGTTLGEFIPPLLAHGYTVIAFDAPAHGASPGRVSDMVEYVSTVSMLHEKYGPFDAAIGHSFGAGNMLWAHRDYGLRAKKIVLIGCFVHGIWIIEAFGDALRLPKHIVRGMRDLLEKKYPGELVWERLSVPDMMKSVFAPVLVVHDRDDRVIPFAHALQLHDSSHGPSEVFATSGLGHKRLLRDRGVVRKVVEFIVGSPSAPDPVTEGGGA